MNDLTSHNPTRQDILDGSLALLQESQDVLGRLISAMRALPETRDEVAALLAQVMSVQNGSFKTTAQQRLYNRS